MRGKRVLDVACGDVAPAIAEARRVLAPGGVARFANMAKHRGLPLAIILCATID